MDFRDVVTEDVAHQQQQEIQEYEGKFFKHTTFKKWYQRIDLNLYKVWKRKKIGPTFIRERFYCSNTLFLKFMKRRVDMKAIVKRFSGFK